MKVTVIRQPSCYLGVQADIPKLSIFLGKNLNIGLYFQAFKPNSFISVMRKAPMTSAIYTTFSDFDFGWGSQSQWKAKPVSFILSHTFQLIRIKLVEVLKQFELNCQVLLLSEFYWSEGKYMLFYWLHQKDFTFGMYADHEWIWFKLGMMIYIWFKLGMMIYIWFKLGMMIYTTRVSLFILV